MRFPLRLGLIYGVLVVLLVSLGVWWFVFLSREAETYERLRQHQMATDLLHASMVLEANPELASDPDAFLRDHYPHLRMENTAVGRQIRITAEAQEAVRGEAQRRRRMFAGEGVFFLMLLAAGTVVLTEALRRERQFKRARELFLAGATHEFRTPLASLRLYAETLARPDLKEADRRRMTDGLVEDVQRLESLVDHVLALSRGEATAPGPRGIFDPGVAAAEVLDEMHGFLERAGALLETDLPSGHALAGDREVLALALRNLVQNAVQYSSPPARVKVALRREGRRLLLSVGDGGPGIPRRDRRRVFESFVRLEPRDGAVKGPTSGSGLGLYLVEHNARLLGGDVDLQSEEGRGSVFTLRLPAASPPETTEEKA